MTQSQSSHGGVRWLSRKHADLEKGMEFLSIQFARRATGACAALAAALAVAPSAASAATSTSTTCVAPTLTQQFAPFGDNNRYALAPGETNDSFNATGWKLSGGARVLTGSLFDGTKGDMLQLPSGAKAVSPAMCVTSAYASARAMIEDVSGSAGVAVSATYAADGHASGAVSVSTGTLSRSGAAWSASSVVKLKPLSLSGWQDATFTLTAGGTGEYRLYNLYIDPRFRT